MTSTPRSTEPGQRITGEFWNVSLEKVEQARRVGDVANILCLPARAEEDGRLLVLARGQP